MRTLRRILTTTASLGVAFSLTACSAAPNPGTAVESLGVTYTESDITVATDELGGVLGQRLARQDVVSIVAASQPYIDLADQMGVGRNSVETEEMLSQLLLQTGVESEDLSPTTMDVLTAIVVVDVISPEFANPEVVALLGELMASPNTIVNPRYGQFDPEMGLVPTGPLADVIDLNPSGM